MSDSYTPKSFWNTRFRKFGHTGEVDSLLYAYDQPQRLHAINTALAQAKISINANTKVLDIGCGTGDVIELLAERGMAQVIGIDISSETIQYAQKRFAANKSVWFLNAAVPGLSFASTSFDLVLGINVLQHVINREAFIETIRNIMRVVKVGGYVLVMDFSPVNVVKKHPASYLAVRSRQEYVDAFQTHGCKLISELGLPRLGVRFYHTTKNTISRLRKKTTSKTETIVKPDLLEQQMHSLRYKIWGLVGIGLLTLTKPFDYLLMPFFPAKYTDMRILIFKKVSTN